ncbi:MAG TPA: OmpA family protein [Fluviicola sp.]|nr:OmpA family protein [Fluviicola sp.]
MRNLTLLIIGFFCANTTFSQEFMKQTKVDSISVLFDYGSANIRNKNQLIQQLNALNVGENGRIELFGYTDTIASTASNRHLAFQRMLSVTDVLGKSKLRSCTIDSTNRNETHGKTLLPDAQFRRVDILVYKVEPTFTLGLPVDLKINFEPGTDNLLPSATPILENLKTILAADPGLAIQLNGHVCCDNDQPLSEKRAERVKSYLVQNGIAANRMSCRGFSNSQPLVEETSEENRVINRRVEVIFSRK